jgi:hypothetical protein
MTMITGSGTGFTAVLLLLLATAPAFAADESKTREGAQQVERGATQVGRGAEDAIRGVGTIVAGGAEAAADGIEGAGKAAAPEAEGAWSQAKNAAVSFGQSVRTFFSTLSASSPFVGRWHWNKAQSTLPPGEPWPNDLTSEISKADRDHVTWSVTIVAPDGEPHRVTFDAPANGESHRLSSDTTASVRLIGDTFQATFQGPTGQSDAQTCTVSADRQQMTCRGILTDRDGHRGSYVDVYDKM